MNGIFEVHTHMKLCSKQNRIEEVLPKFPLQAWIIPPDFDHSEAEAKVISIVQHHILPISLFIPFISQHLVFESDVDGDGHLTKEEILEKYDLFVGSQVSFAQ